MSSATLAHLIATHGYWIVGLVIGLESTGIPLPGETTLITAAVYAGTTRQLNISLVIAAAAFGAIAGDNVGYWAGQRFGYPLLRRYGRLLRIDDRRIGLGQWLFDRHGGKVVFFGRFVAVLRALAALLAGMNRMEWWRFFFFNATGGVVWATLFGGAAFLFGDRAVRVHGWVAAAGAVAAVGGVVAATWLLRRHEAGLYNRIERGRTP